jgi:hypothetical protein
MTLGNLRQRIAKKRGAFPRSDVQAVDLCLAFTHISYMFMGTAKFAIRHQNGLPKASLPCRQTPGWRSQTAPPPPGFGMVGKIRIHIKNTSSAANRKNQPPTGFAVGSVLHRMLRQRVCASARMGEIPRCVSQQKKRT